MACIRTDSGGHALFEPGLARGEGGLAPALLVASDSRGDYGFLSLKGPAFDFTDRGVVVEHGPPAEFFANSRDPRTRQFLSQIL